MSVIVPQNGTFLSTYLNPCPSFCLNRFMRKGIVGDYRNEMPEEYSERFDQFVAEQTAGSDFKFDYE